MKNRRSFIYFFFAVIFMITTVTAALAKDSQQSVNKKGYNEITSSKIILEWKVAGQDLEVILTAPTKGWVAVGFDPSSLMKDANFILGYVDGNEVVVRDDFGTYFTAHAPDDTLGGSTDVVVKEGSESKKETMISFVIPLNSGDENDRVLEEGASYVVLLAFGDKDDFTVRHRKRVKVKITL
jgi:hypothetical protein